MCAWKLGFGGCLCGGMCMNVCIYRWGKYRGIRFKRLECMRSLVCRV